MERKEVEDILTYFLNWLNYRNGLNLSVKNVEKYLKECDKKNIEWGSCEYLHNTTAGILHKLI